MSTDNNKDWVLCRSYRFPNQFYYFNVHNGESKWAKAPKEKTLFNSNITKDLGFTSKFKLNLNSVTEPNNNRDEDVASLMGRQVFYRETHSNCNKSNEDNRQPHVFDRNTKSLPPLFSQAHTSTPFPTKENRQMFFQLLKKKGRKKKLVQTHRSFSPPYLNDNVGRYNFNSLNDTQEGQNAFRICSECGSYKKQKIVWDPYIKIHTAPDNQDEDLPISSITDKMDHINIHGSSNIVTAENFIEQHNQRWFIFRSRNKDTSTFGGFDDTHIKLQQFGRNMEPLTGTREPKHETVTNCFIVVDLNVLLSDFQYINNNVLQDNRYCIVIPYAVQSKLKALAEINHKSRQLMTTAQNLIWKISTQMRHIILEPRQPVPSTSQQVINCCKRIKKFNYSLILLTNDADLYASAIDNNLVSYMLQEVKDGLCGPLFNSHPKYIQNEDVNNNIFLQNPNTLKPFDFTHLNTDHGPGNVKERYASDLVCDLNQNYLTNNKRDGGKFKETYLYEKLRRFSLKNDQMAGPIILRVEDYMCTFTQIMETFMADLLMNENVNYDFCTIPQAVDALVQLYADYMSVKITAYRMSALYNLINQKGKLEVKTKADVLIKMVGCGIILVESIKAVKPNSEILLETEYLLSKLLRSIEEPELNENELDPTKIIDTYEKGVSETLLEGYENRPGDDMEYLNGNFTEYNDEPTPKHTKFENRRIIRTTGRNLNSLRILNNNVVTLDIEKCGYEKNKSIEKNKTDTKTYTNIKNESTKLVFDSTVHENAFTNGTENGPKVILNLDTIKSLEHRYRNKSEKIDTKTSTIDTRDESKIKNNQEECINKINLDKISETYTDVAYQTEVYNSDIVNDKSGTDPVTLSASNEDSGLGKEYCDVYSVVKKFIYDMSSTLNVIYQFIKDTSIVLKSKEMKEEKRREIFDKAYKTYHRMSLVVDNLTNIIKRETESDRTVTSLLERAGVDITNDKRITEYKKIVTTYLEQVDILQQALKIIYIATNTSLLPVVEGINKC